MSSKVYSKKMNSQREDLTLSLRNLSSRYNRLNSNFSDSLYFEFKYSLICLGILFVTFANLHKNVRFYVKRIFIIMILSFLF